MKNKYETTGNEKGYWDIEEGQRETQNRRWSEYLREAGKWQRQIKNGKWQSEDGDNRGRHINSAIWTILITLLSEFASGCEVMEM